MKRRLLAIAKKYGVSIESYVSNRSDMGCQCIWVSLLNNKLSWLVHEDSYYVGGGEQQKCLEEFDRVCELFGRNKTYVFGVGEREIEIEEPCNS